MRNKSLSTNAGLPSGSSQSEVSRVLAYLWGLLRQLKNSPQDPVAPFRISGHQDAIGRARSTGVLSKTIATKQNCDLLAKGSETGREHSSFSLG